MDQCDCTHEDIGGHDGSSDSLEELQDSRAADTAEEEELSVSFLLKYFNLYPLYQDYQEYCMQAESDDLNTPNTGSLSALTIPQELQTPIIAYLSSVDKSFQQLDIDANICLAKAPPVRCSTLWQDLEEVKASGLLGRLPDGEIHLQESIFELIGSEVSYLNSLTIAVKHFYASKELKQSLTPMEHHNLFSNICQIMAASKKFLMDLEGQLEGQLEESVLISQVEDIVLQHCPEFHRVYVPYVTNMRYQETMVNQLLQQNRDFLHLIRNIESHKDCQRQDLKSFLALPFQRITRIKLLLQSILKQTKPDADSISNLEKAIAAIHEIVTECDKGVRKMEQIEELVYLDRLLDFGKMKSVPLVVSGRVLLHQGPMRQSGFSSVYLHLFNDLLVISSKKYYFQHAGFTVMDHAEFPRHVKVEHVQNELLGPPPDSFLLHLSKSHTGQPTTMKLAAETRSDTEVWMKLLQCER
ncbi:ephexin-1 isoform X2 [Pseudochaenichthys georgianus]|uniref:ephexin-1 isoform X2 n=1 Tax=Pseudochaenichthys georgianus TaxID=52239 RepID=UPI00146DA3E0|nr:ephexin-1 isoform X1 [Pseudochaenichthys georgianus]